MFEQSLGVVQSWHSLATLVEEAYMEAGISGKTNHSLQATGATTIFLAAVPENVIQERTGHFPVDSFEVLQKDIS